MKEMYKDNYYESFGPGNYDDMKATQRVFDDSTKWEDIACADTQIIPVSEPMFRANDPALWSRFGEETWEDALENTGVALSYNGTAVALRSCAMKSLLEGIGASGPVFGRAPVGAVATALNTLIPHSRRKTSKVLLRADKASAVLSRQYQYMPASELLQVCEELQDSFGDARFRGGAISHSLTNADFEFPDASGKVTSAYHKVLEGAGRNPGTQRLIPMIQLRTSDTSNEAAKLLTYLKMGDNLMLPLGGIKVVHVQPTEFGRGGHRITCMDKFRQEAKTLYAKIGEDIETLIPKMLNVKINYPRNSFIGLCKYAGIPQKWGGLIEEELGYDFPNGSDCTFLDIYEALNRVVSKAVRDGYEMTSLRVLDLEEGICKVSRNSALWKHYDHPGTVAWSQRVASDET